MLNLLKSAYNQVSVAEHIIFRNCRSIQTTALACCATNAEKENPSPLKNLLESSANFDDYRAHKADDRWATLPYPDTTAIRKQGDFFKYGEKEDPSNTSIILFPGQGCEYVGMAKSVLRYPMGKKLFELANDVLEFNLLDICLNGPEEKLHQTEYSQLAVMVTSLAAIEKLKEEKPEAVDNCVATAGFSVGEITSLVFAGAIQFEDGLKLLKVRAKAMQLACDAHKSAMLTLHIGAQSKLKQAMTKAKEWAIEKGDIYPICQIASYLHPHCKVVSGSISAIEYLEKHYKHYKIMRTVRLPVSGGFHSRLMIPALPPFKEMLDKIEINDPLIYVFANYHGERYMTVDHIRKLLPKQIIYPVKWEQTMHILYERDKGASFPRTFECGPRSTLRPLIKEVNLKAHRNSFCVTTSDK